MRSRILCLLGASLLAGAPAPAAEADAAAPAPRGASDDAKADYKAKELLNKGSDLMAEQATEERGIKMLQSIPQLYPASKLRFKAWMALGRYYTDKRSYDLAIKQFAQIEASQDPDEQAESLYRTGICHFMTEKYENAFGSLRKVTNQYPWSVFANEAYYYIGQCHFKLRRWTNAVEALEMVGTSVPLAQTTDARAEAGQRVFIKLHDQDLVVLLRNGQKPSIKMVASTGDTEAVSLDAIGRNGDYFLASLPSAPGEAVPGDGVLQSVGGTTVTITYDDENTEDAKRHVTREASVALVSTATVGFTDGAYQDYIRGVNGDGEAFVRLRDLDLDASPGADAVVLKLVSRWKEKRVEDLSKGIELDASEEVVHDRDAIELHLTETGARTGVFTGSTRIEMIKPDGRKNGGAQTIAACAGDDLVLVHFDEANLAGEPREVTATAQVLTGRMADVANEQRILTDLDQKARKDLIEARLLLRLAQIFREVGLTTKAVDKADLGHAKIDDVLHVSEKASLSREVVEAAYTVKWELFIAQDRLAEAIAVCNQLIARFPDSSLVDQALLKIGQAKLAANDQQGALQVLASILQMPKSACKAEAQFTIAQVEEERAANQPTLLPGAMMAYKRVADHYPDSPFAGEALDKIANFYIKTQDYERAIELMTQVAQDYEDAPFLDRVYYKWVIAAYRAGRYPLAREKLSELLGRYPNSPMADKAKEFGPMIDKKLGGGAVASPAPAADAGADQ
ncbi:MAG TPA: tetratricopeptide repeat protein [Planctomycetota bacterium]|nr:tetratricopeptide repeat protein [Planctomycetota bacterium]